MAQVQPPPPNISHPPTNGQPGPSSANHSQYPPISWEGDRMFNVYIHDYFVKRGFHKAAKELVAEADIANDPPPPINARQGFLFEWWTVFWSFFSAKTTGNGPENVLLYFQWMQNQADRNRTGDPSRMNQLGLPGQPRMIPRGGPPPNLMRPPGPIVNGVPMPNVGQSQPPIGTQGMPYPIPGIAGAPQPLQQHQQQPPPGPSQINGIVDPNNPSHAVGQHPQRPPSQQQPTRPGPQSSLPPPSHPNAMPHLQPGQRPMPRSHPPGQFQSPTMPPAHPPGAQPHSQMGPSHMGMIPPGISQNGPHLAQHASLMRNSPQGGQPPNNPRNPAQTPTQGFQQPLMNPGGTPLPQGSSGSRSTTPATAGVMTHRSPMMMTHRSPLMLPNESASPGQAMGDDMNRRYQMSMQGPRPPQQSMMPSQQQQQPQQQSPRASQQQPSRPGTSQSFDTLELQQLEQNLARIPPVFVGTMRQEAGIGDRDFASLSDEEKNRLNEIFKKTISTFNGTGSRNRPGQPQQPTVMMGPPQAPQLRQLQPPPPQQQVQGPNAVQRGQKRTSTSPGDEGQADVTPKDQSPPDRKRQRQSPQVGMGQTIPMGDMNTNITGPSQSGFPPGHPANHGAPFPTSGTPQFANGVGFRPGQSNGLMPGHPPTGPNVMSMGSLTPSMGHAMPPGGMAPPMNPALANQHTHQMPGSQNLGLSQQQGAFRHPVAPMHKLSGPLGAVPTQGVASDQSTAGNRGQPQQNKPGSMMPPPSPAHRPESINVPKPANMMPPPSQHTPGNNAGPVKDQTAPSPARLDGPTGSSPSMRPASRSSAGVPAPQNSAPSSNSQGPPNNSLTPAPPTGTAGGNSSGNPPSAPSPSSMLSNRITPPSAAIGSLSRPQTSGPDSNSNASQANNTNNTSTPNNPTQSAPSLSAPSSSVSSLTDSLFNNFFDTMEDNFAIEGLETLDPGDFSQWIDMNPLN